MCLKFSPMSCCQTVAAIPSYIPVIQMVGTCCLSVCWWWHSRRSHRYAFVSFWTKLSDIFRSSKIISQKDEERKRKRFWCSELSEKSRKGCNSPKPSFSIPRSHTKRIRRVKGSSFHPNLWHKEERIQGRLRIKPFDFVKGLLVRLLPIRSRRCDEIKRHNKSKSLCADAADQS